MSLRLCYGGRQIRGVCLRADMLWISHSVDCRSLGRRGVRLLGRLGKPDLPRERFSPVARHEPSGRPTYSITSSVRTSRIGGIERPSALAVFRLITSSNLFGCSTGKSEGLAPLSIRST